MNTTAFGFKIITSEHAFKIVQWRFPRSRKRRIRDKWAKRPENSRREPCAFVISGDVFAHPSIVTRIRQEIS